MNEVIPPTEPSNNSVPIAIAAAESTYKYLEKIPGEEAKGQLQNLSTVIRALDVQDLLLVRLEEIHEGSRDMIQVERPPHINGISSATLQLSLLSYLMNFGIVFLRGFMFYCIWLWFAVPLGAPDIHFAGGIALSVFTLLMLQRGLTSGLRLSEPRRRQTSPTLMRRMLMESLQLVLQHGLLFGLAFLLHLATA